MIWWELQRGGTHRLIPVVWIISSCSLLPNPHQEISPGSLVLSVLNDHPNNCYLINIEAQTSAGGEGEKEGGVTKLKLEGKKSGWDVLTGPWLWWRDPITPLPRLVTHSSHHSGAYRQVQSKAVWVSDGCCVIPPLLWSCRLIPLTGAPPGVEGENDDRDTK